MRKSRAAGAMLAAIAFASATQARAGDLPARAEAARPSVVLLTQLDSSGKKEGTGTGFFVSSSGRIVTNQHVVAGASAMTATLSDGREVPIVGVLAADEARDIAILQAEGDGYPTLVLGDSKQTRIGEDVVVIGSPMGLSSTLSVGIVSAIRNEGVSGDHTGRSVDEHGKSWGLQITAAVSPGSSGSPIMNEHGQVIGVAVGIYGGPFAQALNFGVPSAVVSELLTKVERGAVPTELFRSQKEQRLRNLAISTGVFAAPFIVYFAWRFAARRKKKVRPALH